MPSITIDGIAIAQSMAPDGQWPLDEYTYNYKKKK